MTYWSASSSCHFLRFLSNIFKKQSRNLCFTPLLFCMNHNDLPTKWIFIKESARWSGIHYYDVAFLTENGRNRSNSRQLSEISQGFCWLFWELPRNLNWEILSTKYESEMNWGNNKQNNFAVELISLNITASCICPFYFWICLLMCHDHCLTVCPFLPWIFS